MRQVLTLPADLLKYLNEFQEFVTANPPDQRLPNFPMKGKFHSEGRSEYSTSLECLNSTPAESHDGFPPDSYGYDLNSPIHHVDSLSGKYFLIHGSADDNVHVQNTYEMVDALVNSNKQFDLFIYPDKNHSIYGGYTILHLFNQITDFIMKNL